MPPNSSSNGRESQYCVLWNNYHNTLVSTLVLLRKEGLLVDCTLACTDGGRVQAHQLVLAACSSVCRDFVRDIDSKHPIILLPSDIGTPELRAMVEFMYTGQVCVEQDRLKAFIHGARYLRIKGLEDGSEDTDAEDLDSSGEGTKISSAKEESRPLRTGGRLKDDVAEEQNFAEADDDSKDNWQVVERKPVILPQGAPASPGSRKRRRLTSSRRRPMHLSSSIVCYEQNGPSSKPGNGIHNHRYSASGLGLKLHHQMDESSCEPINKIRRMSTQQGHCHDDLEICTCSSRKTWSVADTEALLKAWGETLTKVPPSYFIRSMSLCKRVARTLQSRGVEKNWRQCQVKMKNLRREVRLFKESRCRLSSRKPSEVANACEKLLPAIEHIFNKEEEIRQEWYQLKSEDRVRVDGERSPLQQRDILAEVAVLAESDLGDDDTDGAGLETEGEGGLLTEGEGDGLLTEGEEGREPGCILQEDHHAGVVQGVEVTTANAFVGDDTGPHHSVSHQPDGTIHHIVEDVSVTTRR
ncbi:uncharacterized protein LOC108668496 [Hyalella azteca]|uniref:Uncharacterized protein LOC108668496 n=1 Tax=Hyalella azteca TaxID=294128 RepID=A0A8B7NC98_HYAAZ|nr:uncharacterized protein LOC108668496 [Hyalella azteca]